MALKEADNKSVMETSLILSGSEYSASDMKSTGTNFRDYMRN